MEMCSGTRTSISASIMMENWTDTKTDRQSGGGAVVYDSFGQPSEKQVPWPETEKECV